MNYSRKDFENLGKIINALTTTSISTVPEILHGYEEFPTFNSPEDLDCRTYEDILINNGICLITDGWTPNNIPCGYKLISLDRVGREIVRSKISIQDYFKQKEKFSITVLYI